MVKSNVEKEIDKNEWQIILSANRLSVRKNYKVLVSITYLYIIITCLYGVGVIIYNSGNLL